jgi:sec-independent protein translocase protein TatA
MPFGVGLPEVLIVLIIALVVFGPKRLPELGKSLGSGMRSFKESITEDEEEKKLSTGSDAKPDAVHAEKSEAPAGGQGH